MVDLVKKLLVIKILILKMLKMKAKNMVEIANMIQMLNVLGNEL